MAVEERRYRLTRLRSGVAELLRGSPALPAQLLAMLTFLVLGASEGGYYPTEWYAAGLFLALLLALTVMTLGLPRPTRAATAGLLLFAGYAAWSHLSILWSDQPGPALEGAGRTTVYLIVVALFALWPLDASGVRTLLAVLGLGLAAIGVVELLRVDAAAQPLSYFDDLRFSEPVGYMNGNVAIWTIGMLACLATAAARELSAPVRALAMGGASVLGTLSLMGQSRGWALALPVALLCFVALGPGRPRKLLVVLVAAGFSALSADAALALHDAFDPERFDTQLSDAVRAALLAGLGATAVGLLGAVVDRRSEARERPALRTRRLVGGTLAAGAAILVAALFALTGLGGWLSDSWNEFKNGEEHAQEGSSRFTNAGTGRYDFWKVSWELFETHPLGGVGADGFQPEYLRRGTSDEQPRFAHSLELGVLAQTGLIGALLLFGALACLLWAAFATVRGSPTACAAAAGACVTAFVYWLTHGSVDWFWELPALASIALACLAAAGALGRKSARTAPPSGRVAVVATLAALIVAISFGLPWWAERNISRAAATWRTDEDSALSLLDQADSLNPLSARASLTAGTIALRTKNLDRAEDEFREALSREAGNNYAWLELGVIASIRGQRGRAVDYLGRAVRLSPRDDVARGALRQVRRGRPLNPAKVNAGILERVRSRQSDAP